MDIITTTCLTGELSVDKLLASPYPAHLRRRSHRGGEDDARRLERGGGEDVTEAAVAMLADSEDRVERARTMLASTHASSPGNRCATQ